MEALVLERARGLHLRDIAEPNSGAYDVVIHVKACGICGSDVHGYDGSTGRRIPPIIMATRQLAWSQKVGSKVRAFAPGDRVTFDSTVSCGTCSFCAAGEINLCDDRQVLGVSCEDYRRRGAFAEYVAVPEHIVCGLPESFEYEKAALIEAVSIAVHAAKITAIEPGSRAVVIGAGMIGLLAMQAFRHYGCSKVFAVDIEEGKLATATSLGADATS